MSLTIESPFHYSSTTHGRKRLRAGRAKQPVPPKDSVPRISRLMALAIHFDGLIRSGVVRDSADLARLGGVSRARITQIMNLLNLAPELQEALLFGGKIDGHDDAPMKERYTRGISSRLDWAMQRRSTLRTTTRSQHRDQMRTRSSASERKRIG